MTSKLVLDRITEVKSELLKWGAKGVFETGGVLHDWDTGNERLVFFLIIDEDGKGAIVQSDLKWRGLNLSPACGVDCGVKNDSPEFKEALLGLNSILMKCCPNDFKEHLVRATGNSCDHVLLCECRSLTVLWAYRKDGIVRGVYSPF